MKSYYLRVNVKSWKAEKLDRTRGDVKMCSKKSIDNFVKGSLTLIVSNKQKNLSKVMIKMRELGYIKSQNILKRSQNTNELEIEYVFSCRKEAIISVDASLECGQFGYDETKEVIVDGIHFLVILKGNITCAEITEEEVGLLSSKNPYLKIGRFSISDSGDTNMKKDKSK
ncbi:TPA_asm: matrix protein [Bacopa monnieri virus 1]|uniref:Matrix protein n=1 Tax=Bacopa monnieri virus 1 TaxID=2813287 RepID=A0AAD2KPQ5_9RHAB|nr:matrix protein [Bacopa monnieri virus 1]DAF42445.1 TPA_asm: matrix protein [Bacopa monnieri virus 1]